MASAKPALWALLFGNLVVGTGILLPAGMLSVFMADFRIDASRAGFLMLLGGLIVGIGAPLLAATTSSIDRRRLLSFALILYVLGHFASAFVTDFTVLLVLRALTVIGAAIFTPQAAATAGLIVPPEQRGAAIGFIFIGWSLASVLGIPAGTLLGEAIGWRATFLGMAGLSAIAAVIVLRVLRPGLIIAHIDLWALVRVLATPHLLAVLLVTLLSMTGQFTLFTYLSPVLKTSYAASPEQIALTFVLIGGIGVLANTIAARLSIRLGAERLVLIALIALAAGFAIIASGWGLLSVFLLGGTLWGMGTFASNSMQQSRLVSLAPPMASATVALNTSFVYLGQFAGAGVGGWLIARGAGPAMPIAGFVLVLTAIAMSLFAATLVSRARL